MDSGTERGRGVPLSTAVSEETLARDWAAEWWGDRLSGVGAADVDNRVGSTLVERDGLVGAEVANRGGHRDTKRGAFRV
jgi:hypothetical protein